MAKWTVACESCGFHWSRANDIAEYERQAIESRPCPGCGAYTLSCSSPKPPRQRRRLASEPRRIDGRPAA